MNFAAPKFLWFMALVLPLVALFLWWGWRKRQQLIGQFVRNRMLAELTLGVSSGLQKARRILLLLAVGLLLLTLARPQWGFTWEEASLRGRDIIVAIDTSRSMMAQDIQPNRLARAKLAAMDLLKLAKYDRLGLVAFAGTAFLQCPLTLDDEAFRQSVEILEPGIIPQGGSALGEAIETARRSFSESETENHRVIVLFTDGEDHEQGVMDEARRAAEAGVRIFTIGVGTAAGELLRVPDESGRIGFLKDTLGNAVKSRLNEELLQQVARSADGFYLPLQGGDPMQVLYEKGLEPLPTSERSTKLMKQFREQYQWPLGLAIVLLLAELFLPDRKRVSGKSSAVTPATAAALLLLAAPMAEGSSASALRKYRAGEYREALGEYRRLIETDPRDPRLQYNAGAAAYQAGELDYALSKFQSAAASPDLDIQQRSFYNMGNALFRMGEQNPNVQERMRSWQESIAAYEAALKLNAQDADARHNLEWVKKKLEELQQQQQQDQQQQQQKNNQDQDQQDNQQNEQKDQDKSQQQEQQGGENQQQKNNSQEQQQQENESEEQTQQQEQERPGNEEQEQSQQQRAGSGDPPQEGTPEGAQEGEAAQLGQMTPAQARQLLDAQKGEEKGMLFVPEAKKSGARNRTLKDW